MNKHRSRTQILSQPQPFSSGSSSKALNAKLWPNGECVVWKARSFKPEPPVRAKIDESGLERLRLFRMMLCDRTLRGYAPLLLGLSYLSIFDRSEGSIVKGIGTSGSRVRVRKGCTGLTSYGKRMVRNAAHLIENEGGGHRAIFATVTVPDFPIEQMRTLHENWSKVVEIYRLYLARALQNKGLSGEIVTVSEIQLKRYERTGLPILHLHSVFNGVCSNGQYAITIENHDYLWKKALSVGLGEVVADCSKACNLQRVKKSASGYMAKYIAKGCAAIGSAVSDGFAGWLPKHWWNCTRTLASRVKQQCRSLNDIAEWLADTARDETVNCWLWHREFVLEREGCSPTTMAIYGQLCIGLIAKVHLYYPEVCSH